MYVHCTMYIVHLYFRIVLIKCDTRLNMRIICNLFLIKFPLGIFIGPSHSAGWILRYMYIIYIHTQRISSTIRFISNHHILLWNICMACNQTRLNT